MSSAYFVIVDDEKPKIFEDYELADALALFLTATMNAESASIRWSS